MIRGKETILAKVTFSLYRNAMNKVEAKVDDLLRFINGAMDTKVKVLS